MVDEVWGIIRLKSGCCNINCHDCQTCWKRVKNIKYNMVCRYSDVQGTNTTTQQICMDKHNTYHLIFRTNVTLKSTFILTLTQGFSLRTPCAPLTPTFFINLRFILFTWNLLSCLPNWPVYLSQKFHIFITLLTRLIIILKSNKVRDLVSSRDSY